MRFSVDLGPEAVEGPSITAAISPDGKRVAQFEHTILVTDDGADVLTKE